jgi:hypothetical protein
VAPGVVEPAIASESLQPPVLAAGGSAQREYDRRKQRREDAVRAKHPRAGGFLLAVTEEPQSTRAWARGAEGERKLAAKLDGVAGVRTLHDRRRPGTRANIDHLVVGPSGVFVIDAKRYSGRVVKRDVGGWRRVEERLYVGSRDCSKLVAAMAVQIEAVTRALGERGGSVPVVPVLCFLDADWGFFPKAFTIDGVLVTWGKELRRRLAEPGPIDTVGIDALAAALDRSLPRA